MPLVCVSYKALCLCGKTKLLKLIAIVCTFALSTHDDGDEWFFSSGLTFHYILFVETANVLL